MTTVIRTAGSRSTRIFLIAAATLLAGLIVAFPTPARADGGHGRGHGYERRHSYGHVHGDGYGPVHGYGHVGFAPVPRSVVVGGDVALPHLAFGIHFGSVAGVPMGGLYTSPVFVAPAPYPYVAVAVPSPYYGPGVYYRGRHCFHGDHD